MTRVRNYAGYFTTQSGKKITFAIMINNFSGSPKPVVTDIEELIKNFISNN